MLFKRPKTKAIYYFIIFYSIWTLPDSNWEWTNSNVKTNTNQRKMAFINQIQIENKNNNYIQRPHFFHPKLTEQLGLLEFFGNVIRVGIVRISGETSFQRAGPPIWMILFLNLKR